MSVAVRGVGRRDRVHKGPLPWGPARLECLASKTYVR